MVNRSIAPAVPEKRSFGPNRLSHDSKHQQEDRDGVAAIGPELLRGRPGGAGQPLRPT
jgi:hypothetical protein